VRWLLRRANIVTAGSDYLLALARAQMPSERHGRLRAAPLGVDLDRFRPAAAGRQEQGWVGLNVGALYPVKGQAMLLRAAAPVPTVRVRIAGEGPLRVRLEQLAGELGLDERLDLMGGVDHGALAGVYGAARVFVQTSRHEAQGMALLEAAACGVPAVGTPVGVLPEIGWTAGTEVELAEALRQLLSDEPQRQALGQSARERVAERYALGPAVGEFRRLYAEAAALRR
jgi:glycosyltransferase involved in cell wall biosynthesis